MAKKTASSIGIILGIAIIVIGFFVQGISIEVSTRTIGSDIRFGADFYTEIYDVTRDVGFAVNKTSTAVAEAAEGVCDAIGWLIIAIGVFDIAYFICKAASADDDSENIVYVQTPAAPAAPTAPTAPSTPTYTGATAYKPAAPRVSTPQLPNGWTCTCGRNHAAYEASCVCGTTKADVILAKRAAVNNETNTD